MSTCHMPHLVPAMGLGSDAIVELYRRLRLRLRPRLASFFLRRTRDPEAAVDLVAETFARALAHARRFRGGAEADPWLWGIARNVLAEHLRRGHAEQRALQRLALEPVVTGTDGPEPHDDRARADRRAVSQALQALVADQRDALRLRVVEELDYAAVAERLGITEPTARARVSRGLRKLRRSTRPRRGQSGAARGPGDAAATSGRAEVLAQAILQARNLTMGRGSWP